MSTATKLLLGFGVLLGLALGALIVASYGLIGPAGGWLLLGAVLGLGFAVAWWAVSPLVQAERELRRQREHMRDEAAAQARQKLEDYFENAAVAMRWVGRDGRILRANQAELDLLGYDEDEYVGRPLADFHVDAGDAAHILKRLAAGEVLRNCEARLRAKDGAIKEVLLDSDVYWRDGQFIHTRCFTRDVTDRKRAEDDARESEERFRALADKAPVLIWMSDRSTQYDFVNQFWLDFTGRPLERELGNGWMEGVHAEDRDPVREAYAAAFQARTGFTLEFRLRRADGAYPLGPQHGRAAPHEKWLFHRLHRLMRGHYRSQAMGNRSAARAARPGGDGSP